MALIQRLQRVRAYNWGAIYAFDADEGDFDGLDGDGPVWRTPHWITIRVLHARTVDPGDADVEMTLVVHDEPADTAAYDEIIDLPSGVLNIGDANADDDVELHPGRWRIQVDLDLPEEARKVQIRLSPLADAGSAS